MDFPTFPSRSTATESMDAADVPVEVIRAEYRFLGRLNRVARTAEHLAQEVVRRCRWLDECPLRVIDFGSGGGDVPRQLPAIGLSLGRPIEAVASDTSDIAADSVDGRARFVKADIREALHAVKPGEFDVSHASLVLHHLSDEDVIRALRSMSAVARQLVIWNDLIRDPIGVVGAWLSTVASNRAIRRDAVKSVRRSFTIAEARTAAEAAGLRDIEIRRIPAGRFLLSASPGDPPARRPTIRGARLAASYGSVSVFSDQAFVAHAGETVLVRGPNGGGKSTLLKCLSGVKRPMAGSVWRDPTMGQVAFLPQEGGIVSDLDAASNVSLFARLRGLRGASLEMAVGRALDVWGLRSVASRGVSNLSIGLRRRVALAATMVADARMVILDEPDAGLDAPGRLTLAGELGRISALGGTVVVASHLPDWTSALGAEVRVVEIGR